ncbi:hypothetical protein, partial [Rhizobium leguminosarum]|uniref:hypothetical protein n=1 Tax=Rhizobium leguminosarum TaxID=384 RepID=UPI0019536135
NPPAARGTLFGQGGEDEFFQHVALPARNFPGRYIGVIRYLFRSRLGPQIGSGRRISFQAGGVFRVGSVM